MPEPFTMHLRPTLSAFLFLFFAAALTAQQNPVKWSFSTKNAGNNLVDLVFTASIDEGWCTYSQFLEGDDGPTATALYFQNGANYKLVGKAKESGGITKVYDKVFRMNISKFKHTAVLTQRVEIKDGSKPISGYLNFIAYNDVTCTAPRDVDFSFKIPALKSSTPKTTRH